MCQLIEDNHFDSCPKMMKQGTSNLSFYFIAENPKGGRDSSDTVQLHGPTASLSPVNDIFLNALMIKMWAVIIINSTHFKTTDCYLANSLGVENKHNRGNTSILYHCIPDHTSKELLLTRAYHMERNRRCKRPPCILAEPGSHLPKAQMFASSLLSSTSTLPPLVCPSPDVRN